MEINKIYNEENLVTMSKMQSNYIDLVITSPPYDNLRNYKGFTFIFEEIALELFRIIKPGGVLIWIVGDATIKGSESLTSFKQAIFFVEKCGFRLHDTMIYESEKTPLNHNRYEQKFEYMFVFSKCKPKTFNPIKIKCSYFGDVKKFNYGVLTDAKKEKSDSMKWSDKVTTVKEYKIKGNIWKFVTGSGGTSNDKIAFLHPAIFPERLVHDHLISWSNENDLVYDPFIGSGTTAKMCILTNRMFIGSEISKEYFDLANKRIDPYIKQLNLFNKTNSNIS
jgi:site-specific DNA-methyltransferase (adenine-specific)